MGSREIGPEDNERAKLDWSVLTISKLAYLLKLQF